MTTSAAPLTADLRHNSVHRIRVRVAATQAEKDVTKRLATGQVGVGRRRVARTPEER
jgi:hypothetical protein